MSAEEAEFHVVYPGAVKEKLKKILRKAKKVGKLERMVEALVEMDRRLRVDPMGLGELTGMLRWMKLPIHVGFVRPLKVDFAIYEERKMVFVKNVTEVTDLESL